MGLKNIYRWKELSYPRYHPSQLNGFTVRLDRMHRSLTGKMTEHPISQLCDATDNHLVHTFPFVPEMKRASWGIMITASLFIFLCNADIGKLVMYY